VRAMHSYGRGESCTRLRSSDLRGDRSRISRTSSSRSSKNRLESLGKTLDAAKNVIEAGGLSCLARHFTQRTDPPEQREASERPRANSRRLSTSPSYFVRLVGSGCSVSASEDAPPALEAIAKVGAGGGFARFRIHPSSAGDRHQRLRRDCSADLGWRSTWLTSSGSVLSLAAHGSDVQAAQGELVEGFGPRAPAPRSAGEGAHRRADEGRRHGSGLPANTRMEHPRDALVWSRPGERLASEA
jgi:hypothetical protein